MKRLIIILFSLVLICCCDPADNRLKIVNMSTNTIQVVCTCGDFDASQLFKEGYYPDPQNDSVYITTHTRIEPDSSQNLIKRIGRTAWKHYVRNCDTQDLHLYFVLDSVVNGYSIEEIETHQLYESHLIKNYNQLQKNNWIIIYKGKE